MEANRKASVARVTALIAAATKPTAKAGVDIVFLALKAAWLAAETDYDRAGVRACIANLRVDAAIADEEIPIADHGSAMPFAAV